MEVIRYINGQQISGSLPVMTVENRRMLQIMKEIEMRAFQSSQAPRTATKRTKQTLRERI